jgi:thiol-disulfide isomerase/thioredoxin
MTRRALIAGFFACLLSSGGCGGAATRTATPSSYGEGGSLVGQPALDVEFSALHGSQALALRSLRGKVVLLDVWASWCLPCQEELPLLDEMAARLAGKDVEIVGLSVDDDPADAERFLERQSSWTLLLAYDPGQKIVGRFRTLSMPTSYVIDRQGVVRHVNAGYGPGDAQKLEAQLLALATDDRAR